MSERIAMNLDRAMELVDRSMELGKPENAVAILKDMVKQAVEHIVLLKVENEAMKARLSPTQADRLAALGRHPSNSPFAMQRT